MLALDFDFCLPKVPLRGLFEYAVTRRQWIAQQLLVGFDRLFGSTTLVLHPSNAEEEQRRWYTSVGRLIRDECCLVLFRFRETESILVVLLTP